MLHMIVNNEPVLINAAEIGTHPKAGWATKHRYERSDVLTLNELTEYQVTGVAHYFRCTETGVVRRWGFDAPSAQGEKDPTRV